MTVKELIERLKSESPDRIVRCRSACCTYLHEIAEVREPHRKDAYDADNYDKDKPLVIDSRE